MSAGTRAARILHISDLHFGHGFQSAKWISLLECAKKLAPDVVVVTGDLVNTPWTWMLRRAKRELDALQRVLGKGDIWVIPGNHDTRITGLLPVRWLFGLAMANLGLALVWWWLKRWPIGLPAGHQIILNSLLVINVVVAGLCLILRIFVRKDLGKQWGGFFLTASRCSTQVPVGVVPFDSASEGVSWARGRIADSSLAKFRSEMEAARAGAIRPITWIAAVHHHPLPLPYDDSTEQMMIMDNAGALMKELSRAGVRLVLHGHKHHQHFARIVVDPAAAHASELAVLSAGTPTSARSAGPFWHGFNVIDIDAEQHVRIEMYEAPPAGGGFELRQTLDLASLEEQDKRRFWRDAEQMGVSCERMLCVARIGRFGDARFVREFRGVRALREGVEGLSGPYAASATSGLVEAFVARSLSQSGPAVSLKIESITLSEIKAAIHFSGSVLQKSEPPIDFALEAYANNAFALNRWQYQCMYPDRKQEDSNEFLNFKVPVDLALEEFFVHIQFPDEIPLPYRIDVKQQASSESPWNPLPRDCLVRIESQAIVQIRIRYPKPGATIRLTWEPKDNIYPTNDPSGEQAISRALQLRERFLKLHTQGVSKELGTLLANLEISARTELGEGEDKQTVAYDIALFAFDEQTKELCYVAGSFPKGDPRRQGRYAFGLGMAGRAFKTATNVAFRKPAYTPSERAWGYVTPDGRRVSDRRDVPEEIILAIPLAPPEMPDWPYAVLQISTDQPFCTLKTADTATDKGIERYCAAPRALTTEFERILPLR